MEGFSQVTRHELIGLLKQVFIETGQDVLIRLGE